MLARIVTVDSWSLSQVNDFVHPGTISFDADQNRRQYIYVGTHSLDTTRRASNSAMTVSRRFWVSSIATCVNEGQKDGNSSMTNKANLLQAIAGP